MRCKRVVSWSPEKQTRYYKKHGNMSEKRFSKSVRAKKSLMNKSPWQKIVSLLSQ